jgi:transcriptional regulator with XRE-family HTH domain
LGVIEVNAPERLDTKRMRRPGGVELDPEAMQALERSLGIRGWTQHRLAIEAGVSKATVNRLMTLHRASPVVLRKIRDALAVSRPDRGLLDIIDGKLD